MRVVIRHHQAIWETITLEVDTPADITTLEEAEAWAIDNFGELLSEAIEKDEDCIVQGDAVEGVDTEYEVELAPEEGKGEAL